MAVVTLIAETFVLRKDLEENNLQIWVYAGIPIFGIGAFVLVFWDQMPLGLADTLFTSLSAIGMLILFFGILMAYLKRRG